LPLDQDWVLAKETCEKLKIFHHVTKLFSGSKYPATNLFFPKICKLKLAILGWINSSFEEVRDMASNMITKFDKYWNKIHGVMIVAAILDPHYKMKLIKFYFPRIYGDTFFVEVEKIKKICADLEKEY